MLTVKKIDVKDLNIELHNIICVHTTNPDYEMSRYILLEFGYEEYVIIEGHHCSCFGFGDVEWEAIEYSKEELLNLSRASYNKGKVFWEQVKIHVE